MSEAEAGPEDIGGGGAPDTAGLAVDLAMEEARNDPSLREDVAAFLRDQRGLIAIKNLRLPVRFKHVPLDPKSELKKISPTRV